MAVVEEQSVAQMVLHLEDRVDLVLEEELAEMVDLAHSLVLAEALLVVALEHLPLLVALVAVVGVEELCQEIQVQVEE